MGAVGAGWVSPSEFWRLHPEEFWWLYESKMPPPPEDRWARLYAQLG